MTADERREVAQAIDVYTCAITTPGTPVRKEMEALRLEIEHGEVLICNYTYEKNI